jgi:hypothetical protein
VRHFGVGVVLAAVGATAMAPMASALDDLPSADFVDRLRQMGPARPFGRPMTLQSSVRGGLQHIQLEALIDRPFRDLQAVLADPKQWCATMILHINNVGCRAEPDAAGTTRILLKVARSAEQPAEQAYDFEFRYQPLALAEIPLAVRLSAPRGPLGTAEHELVLAAVPEGSARTALHMSYAYTRTTLADWAMNLYLNTLGQGRVGFSSASDGADPQAPRVDGVRGLLERNLVLYLCAIEAAAATPKLRDIQDYRQRLLAYFNATERHPLQLRELNLEAYLTLKQPLAPVSLVAAQLQ